MRQALCGSLLQKRASKIFSFVFGRSIVSLARSQFPLATVIELPTAAKRKMVNLFVRNFFYCLPLWFKLKTIRVDAAVCFRSMRNYLETFLFYSARANRFFACENMLLRPEKRVRWYVEAAAKRFFRPELVSYPGEVGEFPLEIEAHRRLVARDFGSSGRNMRGFARLYDPRWRRSIRRGFAHLSQTASKVYPFPLWKEVFSALKPESLTRNILLVGSDDQRDALDDLQELLKSAEIGSAKVHIPGGSCRVLESDCAERNWF